MEDTQMKHTFYQILYWKDKKLSAMSLASVNLMFLIHFISRMNFFTLASYLLLFYIIVGVALTKTIQTTDLQTGDSYEYFTKDEIESLLKDLYKFLMNLFQYHVSVCSLKDKMQTLKFFIGLMFFYYLSICLNETIITWIVLNMLFLWVPIHESNREKIDSLVDLINNKMQDTYMTIKAKIPKYEEVKMK